MRGGVHVWDPGDSGKGCFMRRLIGAWRRVISLVCMKGRRCGLGWRRERGGWVDGAEGTRRPTEAGGFSSGFVATLALGVALRRSYSAVTIRWRALPDDAETVTELAPGQGKAGIRPAHEFREIPVASNATGLARWSGPFCENPPNFRKKTNRPERMGMRCA